MLNAVGESTEARGFSGEAIGAASMLRQSLSAACHTGPAAARLQIRALPCGAAMTRADLFPPAGNESFQLASIALYLRYFI